MMLGQAKIKEKESKIMLLIATHEGNARTMFRPIELNIFMMVLQFATFATFLFSSEFSLSESSQFV